MIDPELRSDVLRFLMTECHILTPASQPPRDQHNIPIIEETVVIESRDDFDQFMRRADYAQKTWYRGAQHIDDTIQVVVIYLQPDCAGA